MIDKINPVTPDILEILSILQEEAAEVIVAISKVDRFGLDSCHPDTPGKANIDHLEEELGDFMCLVNLLTERGIIYKTSIDYYAMKKLDKLKKYSGIL